MRKVVKLSIPLAIIIIAFAVIFFQDTIQTKKTICFSSTCIKAEIADSPRERAQGLMYRYSLSEDEGMLFIFETEEKHAFWMKNTFIPLDMIWIDKNKKIVDIKTTQPCQTNNCETFIPSGKAIYVFEANAGFAEKNNIKIGDDVEIK
jgi:uncharacterized membrane protein (UPF0127 family)